MKRLVTAVLVGLIFISSAHGQTPMRLTSVTVGSGEDPITSGVSLIGDFSPAGSQKLLELAFQSEQAWIAVGRSFGPTTGLNGTIVADVGHFQGAVWGGPRLTLDLPMASDVHADLIEWPGWFLGNPRSYAGRPFHQPIGQYGGVSLTLGPITLSEGHQRFLGDRTNWLPGASYSMHVMPDIGAVASATYNENGHRWMYYIGSTWTLPSPKSASSTLTEK